MSNEELSPELERSLQRYFNRTGIFRMYQLERPGSGQRSRLIVEFVIRGYVLGHIRLWRRKSF